VTPVRIEDADDPSGRAAAMPQWGALSLPLPRRPFSRWPARLVSAVADHPAGIVDGNGRRSPGGAGTGRAGSRRRVSTKGPGPRRAAVPFDAGEVRPWLWTTIIASSCRVRWSR
jgi:hypothetical protein